MRCPKIDKNRLNVKQNNLQLKRKLSSMQRFENSTDDLMIIHAVFPIILIILYTLRSCVQQLPSCYTSCCWSCSS